MHTHAFTRTHTYAHPSPWLWKLPPRSWHWGGCFHKIYAILLGLTTHLIWNCPQTSLISPPTFQTPYKQRLQWDASSHTHNTQVSPSISGVNEHFQQQEWRQEPWDTEHRFSSKELSRFIVFPKIMDFTFYQICGWKRRLWHPVPSLHGK